MFCLLFVTFAFATLADEQKERPVTAVVNLLKDMKGQLEKEKKQDEDMYEKLECWCKTNTAEKTAAVAAAEDTITQLNSVVETLTAKGTKLEVEVEASNGELAAAQKALATAPAIREKEHEEFQGEEKDLLTSIKGLEDATQVLDRTSGSGALIQGGKAAAHVVQKAAAVKQSSDGFFAGLRSSYAQSISFLQQSESQAPGGGESYNAAGGGIGGTFKDMTVSFDKSLAQAQADEATAQEAFVQLKAAKTAEIAAAQKSVDLKTAEHARTAEANADAKGDRKDTRDSLSADQKFMLDLAEKCRTTDAEWESRTKARNDEIAAVGEAISILAGDDARDTFSKTFNFVQLTPAHKAIEMLQTVAKKEGLKTTAFTQGAADEVFAKIMKESEKMIEDLKTQQKEEVEHRDSCIAELNENEKQTTIATNDKEDLEARIAGLTSLIDQRTTEIAGLNAEISEMRVQIKRASEDRETENKEFQQTVADQRATQAILQKALERLQEVYGDSFLQQSPPGEFSEYKQNAGAGGVLGLINKVINDAKDLEAEATKAEQDAQSAYESFVRNSNDSIAAKNKSILSKQESKAKAESDRTDAKASLKDRLNDLQNLANMAADLHKSCDYTLQHFDDRQAARVAEIDGLRSVSAVLTGSAEAF